MTERQGRTFVRLQGFLWGRSLTLAFTSVQLDVICMFTRSHVNYQTSNSAVTCRLWFTSTLPLRRKTRRQEEYRQTVVQTRMIKDLYFLIMFWFYISFSVLYYSYGILLKVSSGFGKKVKLMFTFYEKLNVCILEWRLLKTNIFLANMDTHFVKIIV